MDLTIMVRIKNLAARSYTSGELIVLVAVFLALFANLSFFMDLIAAFGTTAPSLAFALSAFFALCAAFVLMLSALCHRRLVKPVLIAALLAAAGAAYFTGTFGTLIDADMLANVLQTDTAEASDLLNVRLALYILLLGILPSVAIWRARLVFPDWRSETRARLKLAAAAALVLTTAAIPHSAQFASLFREHRASVRKITPAYALMSAARLAAAALTAAPQAHQAVAADAQREGGDVHRELVIMVVGETARADHWQLNGYARETAPNLSREGVINFPDFWSCGTSTAHSVPCMFSNLGRGDFDTRTADARDNALDILARSGVSILWRDNNSSSKGVAARVPYEDFKSPARNSVCDEECRDEGMLEGLQDHIDAQKGDVLIVLHQMGNHGPAYYKRYPKAFETYTPACRTSELGSCTVQEIINAYDNALRYTDHFLGKVIALLKENDARFETAMMYVSDHGESLGEYGVYLHSMPYALAPTAQRHVPAVIWLGKHIRHEIRMDSLETRRLRRASHDNIFATLLGLFEIRSQSYDPDMDLLVHTGETVTRK